MHNFNARQLAARYRLGIEVANTTRKLGTVQVANSHNFASFELPCQSRDSWRPQAFARLPQGPLRAVVHHQCSFWMMEKGDPAFAALELVGLGHEQSALLFGAQYPRESPWLLARRYHQWD